MHRRYEDRKINRREWKEHRLLHIELNEIRALGWGAKRRQPSLDPKEVECVCDEQVGRFRKRDAYDCGRPGCGVCHGDKFPRRLWTRQETRAELRLQEQLLEILQGDL